MVVGLVAKISSNILTLVTPVDFSKYGIVHSANYVQDRKYKVYNQLRNIVSREPVTTPSKKRCFSDTQPQISTPNSVKCLKQTHHFGPAIIEPCDLPIPTVLSPAQARTSIGPTPQKDGQVVGLFDRLPSRSKNSTPSKRALSAVKTLSTPSKLLSVPVEDGQGISLTICKQDGFSTLTPQTQRITKSCTPGSKSGVRKLRYDDTPAFLRRDSQRAPAEGGDGDGMLDVGSWSPISIRKVPKAAGRGLSALVKGLRDMEDEALDDELYMLREMEGFESPATKSKKDNASKVLVRDSQATSLPLGPDGGLGSELDDTEDEGGGKDGKPFRVWKKKGQKRTTKRVTMKPNNTKWKPEPRWKGDDNDDDEERKGKENSEVVEQALLLGGTANGMPGEVVTGDLCRVHDITEEGATKEEMMDKMLGETQQGPVTKSGLLVKAKKKISATAHANFRALKIRSKSFKTRGSSRFGRR